MLILEEREVYFPSPLKFNDPFDCRIVHDYSEYDDVQIRRHVEKYIDMFKPDLSSEKRDLEINIALNDKKFENNEFKRSILDGAMSQIGIFSVSRTPTSNLMWGHYSDSHMGFCVGFDADRLDHYFKSLYEKSGYIIDRLQIDYVREYPVLNSLRYPDQVEHYTKLVGSKSDEWKYEEEYRFLSIRHSNFVVKLPSDSVVEVIVGYLVPPEFRTKIISNTKKQFPKAKIFQVNIKEKSFELTSNNEILL